MATCNNAKISIVLCGHVDHGKSTLAGRLLADSGGVSSERVRSLRETCRRDSKPFEFAHLIDSFREEQAQGITIETARVYLRSGGRELCLIDAPGHAELVRNMVTGAARADAALLTIDAREGVRESTRRHASLLALLGIRKLILAINKMDLVDYSQAAFQAVARDASGWLGEIGLAPTHLIPVSGFHGDNVTERSAKTPWYSGPPLLELMTNLSSAEPGEPGPFRLPVQAVYDRRIVAGTVASGWAGPGDELTFLPSGARARITEALAGPLEPGRAVGFRLDRDIGVARGQIAVHSPGHSKESPADLSAFVTRRLRARIFWLGAKPLSTDRELVIRLSTQEARCRVEHVSSVIDSSTLAEAPQGRVPKIHRGEIAECELKLNLDLVVDPAVDELRRLVLIDGYEIAGGGLLEGRLLT